MQKRGVSQILLGYYGAGDPRIYGIRYQDLVSPALVSRHYRGEVFAHWPGRVILVVSNRLLQPMPVELIPLLQNRRPLDQIGYTLQAYDLTGDAEALGHVAALYERTHRKNIAKQFLRAVQGRG
jgi:hypothetical protein